VIEIRITKELLDGYRTYKVLQVTEDIEEVFYYTTLTYLMKQNTLSELYERLGDFLAITIDVETNERVDKERRPRSI